MDESYFMYHEDTDLSLRCHLAGLRVVYCPDAVALHAYDFARNAEKMYLLERNRFLTVLADFPTHLLLRVLPVIVLLEPLYLLIAMRDGWGARRCAPGAGCCGTPVSCVRGVAACRLRCAIPTPSMRCWCRPSPRPSSTRRWHSLCSTMC